MKKTLLQEVKAMNKIAGTELTKEQEISLIKNRLQELEFGTQDAFDSYKKNHDMRPDTKVTVAGKNTTAGQASKNSKSAKPTGKPTKLSGAPLKTSAEKPKSSDGDKTLTKVEKAKITKVLNKTLTKAQEDIDKKYGFLDKDGFNTSDNNVIHSFLLQLNRHPNKKLQKKYNADLGAAVKKGAAAAGITHIPSINKVLYFNSDKSSTYSGNITPQFSKQKADMDMATIMKRAQAK